MTSGNDDDGGAGSGLPEPGSPTHVRAVDVARAARIAVASLHGDRLTHDLVIDEALADDDGGGIARLISALAGQGAFASQLLSPAGDPTRYLLDVLAVAVDAT